MLRNKATCKQKIKRLFQTCSINIKLNNDKFLIVFMYTNANHVTSE